MPKPTPNQKSPAKKASPKRSVKATGMAPPLTGKTKPHVQLHADGSIWAKGEMRDGVMVGHWEWFRKDGSLMRTGAFVDGAQVGAWTTYAADGRVVKVTQMKRKA